jgi:hypothetical protein
MITQQLDLFAIHKEQFIQAGKFYACNEPTPFWFGAIRVKLERHCEDHHIFISKNWFGDLEECFSALGLVKRGFRSSTATSRRGGYEFQWDKANKLF